MIYNVISYGNILKIYRDMLSVKIISDKNKATDVDVFIHETITDLSSRRDKKKKQDKESGQKMRVRRFDIEKLGRKKS